MSISHVNPFHIIVLVCMALFLGMAFMPYVGHRIARWQSLRGMGTSDRNSIVTVTGALFALLGLLIAFTFSGAFSRFDDRRQNIVREANSIGQAYALIDILSGPAQARLRPKFSEYAAVRSELFDLVADLPLARRELARSIALQNEIWRLVVEATSEEDCQSARLLLLPALNEMISITTVRTITLQKHQPLLIYFALAAVALICSGLVGYSAHTGKRYRLSSVHVIGFAGVIAFILYVILDVEFARYGMVTLDNVNQLLKDLADNISVYSSGS